MKQAFLAAKTPSWFDSLCVQVVFFNETKDRHVSKDETKAGQNKQLPANPCKGFSNADSISVYSAGTNSLRMCPACNVAFIQISFVRMF